MAVCACSHEKGIELKYTRPYLHDVFVLEIVVVQRLAQMLTRNSGNYSDVLPLEAARRCGAPR